MFMSQLLLRHFIIVSLSCHHLFKINVLRSLGKSSLIKSIGNISFVHIVQENLCIRNFMCRITFLRICK